MRLARRSTHLATILLALLLLLPSAAVVAETPVPQAAAPDPSTAALNAANVWTLRLPTVQRNYLPPLSVSSRFGVCVPNVGDVSVTAYPTNQLNVGWYLDWAARVKPPRPGGIKYAHMIHLRMDGPSSPSGTGLGAIVRANPGRSG